jgi:hypothetical protein
VGAQHTSSGLDHLIFIVPVCETCKIVLAFERPVTHAYKNLICVGGNGEVRMIGLEG